MKKVLLFAVILFTASLNAQETDQQKMMSILDSAKKNFNSPLKMDSLVTEAEKLKTSTDVGVKIMISQVIDALKTKPENNFTAKPLKNEYNSLDKDYKKQFVNDFDKFKNVSFIKAKITGFDMLKPYISVKDNVVRLRLETIYKGFGWLFFKKAIVIVDGVNYEYDAGTTDREVLSGSSVREESDVSVDENILKILNLIASSNNPVEMRLTGDKYSDFKISEKQKERIKSVLDLYFKLTE